MRDNASLPTKHGISVLFDLTAFKITSATSKGKEEEETNIVEIRDANQEEEKSSIIRENNVKKQL